MKFTAEYVFYALRRSGHHAVIDALRAQLAQLILFVNDGEVSTHPLSSERGITLLNWKHAFPTRVEAALGRIGSRLPLRGVLIHNYEDFQADGPRPPMVTAHPIEVAVVRDPFNLIASRLKWHRSVLSQFESLSESEIGERLVEAFRAQVALADLTTNGDVRLVKYDHWAYAEGGAEEAARAIGVEKPLVRLDQISEFGPGSSFDAMGGDASKIRTTERWRNFADDATFLGAVIRPEVLEWTERFFPSSSGLEWAKQRA